MRIDINIMFIYLHRISNLKPENTGHKYICEHRNILKYITMYFKVLQCVSNLKALKLANI